MVFIVAILHVNINKVCPHNSFGKNLRDGAQEMQPLSINDTINASMISKLYFE